MANPEHRQILQQGVEAWNAWREQPKDVSPDLPFADLLGADLHGTGLREADLTRTNLTRANLSPHSMQSLGKPHQNRRCW